MGDKYLQEYMSRLGWGSGFNLPVANNENRELEKQLEEIQRKGVKCRQEIDDEESRAKDLKIHSERTSVLLKNIAKMDQTHRASLEHARTRNAAAENTSQNVAKDLKMKNCLLLEDRARHEKIRAELEKRQVKVDQLSAEIEWDQKAVAAVRSATKDEETDIEMMAKYFTLDENAIKEAETVYRAMKGKHDQLKAELEARVIQVQDSELTLHRVCDQFREVHRSRNYAVALWKGVIDSLKMRDVDLKLMAEDYVNLKGELRDVTEQVKEQESLLKTNEENTAEVERYLRHLTKSTADIRHRISSHKSNLKTYMSQLTSARLDVENLSGELKKIEKRKATCEAEAKEIGERENQLKSVLDEVRQQHKKFKHGSSSTDEKFRQLGSILDFEEERLDAQEKERERLRGHLAEGNQKIVDLKKYLESTSQEMKFKRDEIRRTKRDMHSQGLEMVKQRRRFLEFDQKTTTLQEKVAKHFRSDGTVADPTVMVKKLDKLKQELQQGLRNKVQQESLKSFTDSVLQRVKKEIHQFTQQGIALDNGNDNLSILLTSYQKDDVTVVKVLNQTKFEFQMVLLSRHRLMQAFQKRKDRYFSANMNYLELEAATGERRAEIQSYMTILEQRKKNLVDSRTRLLANSNQVESALKGLKTKYEFVMTSMGTGIEGGGVSEAFLIVKFAQERAYLIHEGEEWDNRVKRTEEEIEALQNTVVLISSSNQDLKTSLAPPWKNSSVRATETVTDKLFRDFMIEKHKTERHLHELLRTRDEKESEYQHALYENELMRGTLNERRHEINLSDGVIANQRIKIDRANLLNGRRMKQMGESIPEEQRDLVEETIKLHCTRDKYEMSVRGLLKAVESYPEMLPWILDHIKSNKSLVNLYLEMRESVASIAGKATAVIRSKKFTRRPESRDVKVSSLVRLIKGRDAERIMSAVPTKSTLQSQKNTTPPPSPEGSKSKP